MIFLASDPGSKDTTPALLVTVACSGTMLQNIKVHFSRLVCLLINPDLKTFKFYKYIIEPHHEKTNILVSELVQHKPGCKATEDR